MPDDRAEVKSSDTEAKAARVDAAHVFVTEGLRAAETAPDAVVQAAAGKCTALAAPQLARQAAELADQLRQQQRELSRREASLHARLAVSEGEQRAVRLTHHERELELARRQAELDEAVRQHESRVTQLDAAQLSAKALDARGAELEEREHRLAAKEKQLRSNMEEVNRQAAWLHHARGEFQQQRLQQQEALAAERDRLAEERRSTEELKANLRAQLEATRTLSDQQRQLRLRHEQLDRLQRSLREQTELLARDRKEQEGLHHQNLERIANQRRALADLWQSRRSRYQQELASLIERGRQLEQRHMALDQLRDAVAQRQREVLELQLAVEQVRAEFDGRVTPAELTLAIESVRGQLADQLALADQDLRERRQQLRELSARLYEQQHWLNSQRAELQQWVARRRRELRQQAQQLLDRQQELESQERQFLQAKQSWERLRHEYLERAREPTDGKNT